MITHAEYHAANPLPDHSVPTLRRVRMYRKSVSPLGTYVEPSRPYRKRTTKQEAYVNRREQDRDVQRAAIRQALNSPDQAWTAVGVLSTMVHKHRCRILKHLYAMEKAGVVERIGQSSKTRWRLTREPA